MDEMMALTLLLFFWSAWAFSLQTLATKTETPNGWFGWIPILNVILMIQIAQKPMWWIVLLMIPFVNVVASIMILMALCDAVDKPKWIGVVTLVPVIGWFVLPYIALTGDEQLI